MTGVKPNMGTHQYGKEAERGGEEIEEEDGEDEEGSRHEDSLDEEDVDPEEALDLLDSKSKDLKREKKRNLKRHPVHSKAVRVNAARRGRNKSRNVQLRIAKSLARSMHNQHGGRLQGKGQTKKKKKK